MNREIYDRIVAEDPAYIIVLCIPATRRVVTNVDQDTAHDCRWRPDAAGQ